MPDPSSCIRHDGNDVLLSVRVQPRASRNEVLGVRDGYLRVRTTAAPAGGAANRALVRLLATYLDVAPTRIRVERGKTQRNKQLRIFGPVSLPAAVAPGCRTNGL